MCTYPHPNQSKEDNLNWAKSAIQGFCKLNGITPPKIRTVSLYRGESNIFGSYTRGKDEIFVNLFRSRTPIKVPGFSWSYTGYKADLTTAGIAAHEFGHYLDYCLGYPSSSIKRMVKEEKNVSSYEPNASETFAEMMKLFILNPDLLRVGRPTRYRALTETLGFRPYITASWEEVLGNAHPKLIAAAKTWISQGAPKNNKVPIF